MRRFLAGISLSLAALAATLSPTLADGWPERDVKVVIGFNPGVTDLVTRVFTDEFQKRFNRPFVIENRAGASGATAASFVAQQQPDGYTLFAIPPAHTVLPSLRHLDFDAVEDFTPITVLANSPNAMVVKADGKFASFDDVKAALANEGGAVSYASSGIGTTTHLTGAMLEPKFAGKLRHVPYKSGSESVTALLGGHVDAAFSSLNLVLPLVESGELKVIAVAAEERSPFAEQIPTFAELGYEDVVVGTWFGLLGPKGLDEAIVTALYDATKAVMNDEAVRAKLQGMGVQVIGMSPEEFGAFMKSEVELYGRIAQSVGLARQ